MITLQQEIREIVEKSEERLRQDLRAEIRGIKCDHVSVGGAMMFMFFVLIVLAAIGSANKNSEQPDAGASYDTRQ